MAGETGPDSALVVFQGKSVRRVYCDEEWHFSVIDIIAILTDSSAPRRYWSDLKAKMEDEGFEPYDKIVQLKMPAEDGKLRFTDCVNTKNAFRLIQAIPSKKAEPFKLWLAKVGYERVQEIENPELAQERMKRLYEQKGYSKEWIEKRLRGIAIRQELTDEWKDRDIRKEKEFAMLTNEISLATFGKTVEDYKRLKRLGRENLRDHMNDLELIFGMLGEKVTTEITRARDTKGFHECKGAAREGGEVAGSARKDAEGRIGKSIVTGENYLEAPEKEKRKALPSKAK
jgi:DNA-damage-inducible protein D